MADESKKIIFQIDIDNNAALGELVELKDRISKLKVEQKALNTTTLEGKKQYEAYNAQIKALTKEQKSLELGLEKTAAAFEYESGSIAHNRAELSRLTAEYKNLANPTKEQTDKIKGLSDRLKEQEAAIGNTSRNVGNYKEAILEATQSTGLFGGQIGQAQQAFTGLKGGLSTAAKGFGTLKGAIISTGIGALIIAIISLVQYFTSTDTGATQLAGVMGALGEIMRKVTGFFVGMGKAIVDLGTGTKSLGETFKGLGDAIIENITNRLKAPLVLLDALKQAFNELAENGLDGDFSPALKTANDAMIQFNLGITDGTDKIAAFSKDILDAAKAAYEYAVALDDIEDRQRDLNVENAKTQQTIEVLLKQSKDRTKSESDRIAILEKASALDESSAQKQIALDKERLKLIQDRNARELENINQGSSARAQELSELNKLSKLSEAQKLRQVELATELIAINDDLAQEQADLQVKIINQETGFLKLREKNQATINALREAEAAERKKLNEDEKQLEQDRIARLRALTDAEINLETQRLQNRIKNIDIAMQAEELSFEDRVKLLERRAEIEKQIEANTMTQKLANDALLADERTAILEATAQREIEIEAQKNATIKKLEEAKAAEDEKIRQKKLQDAATLAQQIAQVSSLVLGSISSALSQGAANNADQLAAEREAALKGVAGDKEKEAKINEKYDKLAEAARKKAAKQNLQIQLVQGIINTAVAVTQALASSPPPFSFILAAITAAAGAVQTGVITNQISKLADGGLLKGPSHANGGIKGTGRFGNIEVEGGEMVMSKRATAENFGVLSEMNHRAKIGMHRPSLPSRPIGKFADGGFIDGGFAARNLSSPSQQRFEAMKDQERIMKMQPAPILRVTDLHDVEGSIATVRGLTNF
jgi:hypothetical protein